MPKLAVFGTLKQNKCNNWRMEEGKAKFIGNALTKNKMALSGLALFEAEVAQVRVELYEMEEEQIKKMVDPIELHAYTREVRTVVTEDGVEHEANMYVTFPQYDNKRYDTPREDGYFEYRGW